MTRDNELQLQKDTIATLKGQQSDNQHVLESYKDRIANLEQEIADLKAKQLKDVNIENDKDNNKDTQEQLKLLEDNVQAAEECADSVLQQQQQQQQQQEQELDKEEDLEQLQNQLNDMKQKYNDAQQALENATKAERDWDWKRILINFAVIAALIAVSRSKSFN